MMNRAALALVLVGAMTGSIGCKSVKVSATPGTDLSRAQSFYVIQRENGGVHQVIADELILMGHHATAGLEDSMPSSTGVMVTFNPKWQWDITMYLLELKVEFRNPRDKTVLVSGRSYRPSLQRTDSSVMAREVLTAMFAEAKSPPAADSSAVKQGNE